MTHRDERNVRRRIDPHPPCRLGTHSRQRRSVDRWAQIARFGTDNEAQRVADACSGKHRVLRPGRQRPAGLGRAEGPYLVLV